MRQQSPSFNRCWRFLESCGQWWSIPACFRQILCFPARFGQCWCSLVCFSRIMCSLTKLSRCLCYLTKFQQVSAGIGISNEIPAGFIVFQRTSGQFQLVLFSASDRILVGTVQFQPVLLYFRLVQYWCGRFWHFLACSVCFSASSVPFWLVHWCSG